jgi:hypothetical protein
MFDWVKLPIPTPAPCAILRPFLQWRTVMANSKALAVQRKHRRRQRAAKEKVQLHLDGKIEAERLPALAKNYLVRRLRVTKRG